MFDFPTVVEALDDVPEPYRALYGERDGAFHLDEALAKRLDVSGLTSALEKERRAAREAEKALKGWQALGASPDEVAALLGQAPGHEARTRHQAALKAKDEQIAKMRESLERHLIDAAATAELAKQRGVAALLLPHVRASLKVVEDEDGGFAVRVLGEDGQPRLDEQGRPLSIADLVGEMRQSETFARAFEAAGATGSGMQPGAASGARPAGFMLSRDQARDPAAYRRVRDEARRAGALPTITD